jgi:hypothetical protein
MAKNGKPSWFVSPEELGRPRIASHEPPAWVTAAAWWRDRDASLPSIWIETTVDVAEKDDEEVLATLYKRRSCALSSREVCKTPAGNA